MSKDTFRIVATGSLKRRYRELLTTGISENEFLETLSLVRGALESGGARLLFAWESPPKRRPPYPIPTDGSDYLRMFLERTNEDLETDLPENVPSHTQWERYAFQAAVFLTFQSRVRVTGETGFLRDAQSLLFLASVHITLPKLHTSGRTDAHDFLVHAAFAFPPLGVADAPAHHHHLLGVLYDYLGDTAMTQRFLEASLGNTSPSDHDYLTRVQAYWSALIQAHAIDQAKELLLRLYRSCPPEHLAEIREMLDDTYSYEAGRFSRAS